jgi:hypothetical protein
MATTLAPSALKLPARAIGRHDRLFYGAMSVVMGLAVFAGFSPTYYLRLFSGGPMATLSGGSFTTLVHVHGALFTAWVLLFIVHTALISARRVAVHRRLGVAGAVLAAAMITAGTLLAIATARRGSAPPGMEPIPFLAIPLFDMVLFATFVTAALALRRDKEAHKRLMLLAYVSTSPPPWRGCRAWWPSARPGSSAWRSSSSSPARSTTPYRAGGSTASISGAGR